MIIERVEQLLETSLIIRDKVIKVAHKHQASHVGSCLSCVELMVYLYYYRMKKGDIFILSKGHAGLTLYTILEDKGLIKDDELWDYQNKFGVHPEVDKERGIFASTGSLGHGLPIGVGYALADRSRSVYVLMSDGELDEGSNYEALRLKGELGLNNLFPIVDRNGFKGYDEIKTRANLTNGHNFEKIDEKFENKASYPLLEFQTVKGRGIKRLEGKLESHYWPINNHDYEQYQKDLFS